MGTTMIENANLYVSKIDEDEGDYNEPDNLRITSDHCNLGVFCGSYRRSIGKILWEHNSSNITNAIQNVVRGYFFSLKSIFFCNLHDAYTDRLPLDMFMKELVDEHILWYLIILSKNGHYEIALEEAISLHKVA